MNNPDLIINQEEFKSIKSNVICPICNGILLSPVQCSGCKNIFCSPCLENWNINHEDNYCPFFCTTKEFNSVDLGDILLTLKFKCINNCLEAIPYFDLEDHYKSKCPKIDYKEKYLSLNSKYNNLLQKYNELKSELIVIKNIKNFNAKSNNIFISAYHPHILYDRTQVDEDWACDICGSTYDKKKEIRFGCSDCDFDICIKCKMVEESGYKYNNLFYSKKHNHLLKEFTFEGNDWICDNCNVLYLFGKEKRFRCVKCDFDLCNQCKMKEENDMDN